MAFFFLIVGINVFFFLFWIYKMYHEIRVMAILKYSKVYLALCLCFNQKRLAIEKKAAGLA